MYETQIPNPAKFHPDALASEAAVQRILAVHGTRIWPVALLSALAGAGLFTVSFIFFRLF